MHNGRPGHWVFFAAAGMLAALSGCAGGGSGTSGQSQGGLFGLFASKTDPNKDLTVDQGHKLLLEIRKDPKRMDKLTPAERRFLAKAVVASDKSR
ncbi:MAG: hypothetical protein KF699_07235 [Phycisphaeraceae bacterium]|nr:hypothetical protein [Phycisphaeraceae bacterium]